MPKLEIRDMHPMFALNTTDARKIATEVVRRCETPARRQHQPGASEKAREWAGKLVQSRQYELLPDHLLQAVARLTTGGPVAAKECSQLIDALKELPYRARPAARPQASPKVTDGFYKLGDDYVKVQQAKHGSGHLYAKRWDGAHWQYESGLVHKLTPAMELTAEQAREWGKLYGNCIFCSIDLTDERSIDAGYGPKCAAKRGLPWG